MRVPIKDGLAAPPTSTRHSHEGPIEDEDGVEGWGGGGYFRTFFANAKVALK